MPTLTINEMAVHYRAQGQAGQPTLVLVHGLGCSLKYWSCVFEAPEFAAYRIIALDLPGFGRSAKSENYDYRLPSQAAVVLALLRELQVEQYILIGHSMGGTVAILMALQQPPQLARLIVIEPNLRACAAQLSRTIVKQTEDDFTAHYAQFQTQAIATVKSWFIDMQQADLAEYIAELLQTTPVSMYRSAASLMQVTAAEDFLLQFQQLALPKYFLVGAETLKTRPLPESLRAADMPVIVVPGVGHMMMVDDPAIFTNALAGVLA